MFHMCTLILMSIASWMQKRRSVSLLVVEMSNLAINSGMIRVGR